MKAIIALLILLPLFTTAQKIDTMYLFNKDSARITASLINTQTGKEIGMSIIKEDIFGSAAIMYNKLPFVITVMDNIYAHYDGINKQVLSRPHDYMDIKLSERNDVMYLHIMCSTRIIRARINPFTFGLIKMDTLDLADFPSVPIDFVETPTGTFMLAQKRDSGSIHMISDNFTEISDFMSFNLKNIMYEGATRLIGLAIGLDNHIFIASDKGLHRIKAQVNGTSELMTVKHHQGITDMYSTTSMRLDTNLVFNKISLKYLGDNKAEITLDIRHAEANTEYRIQVSKGTPNDFKTILVVFGSDVVNTIKKIIVDL